jgi:hypothetical protein
VRITNLIMIFVIRATPRENRKSPLFKTCKTAPLSSETARESGCQVLFCGKTQCF